MKVSQSPDPIIQLDHSCDEVLKILVHGMQCVLDSAKTTLEKAYEAFVGVLASNSITTIPMCKLFTQSLKCLNTLGCLSDQERVFLQNMFATIYRWLFEGLMIIEDDFGGFISVLNIMDDEDKTFIMEKLGRAGVDVSDLELVVDRFDLILETIVDDYKVKAK